MSSERIFTDEELRALETKTLDLLQAAIADGDKEQAALLARRMYEEFNFLHDGYMFWVTGLQTYIYNNFGIKTLEDAEKFAHILEGKTVFKDVTAPKTFREHIEFSAKAMRGHLQPMEISEDDEKVIITMKPCGSGERLIEKGAYNDGYAIIKERSPITYGFENMPIYCTHCPIMEQIMVDGTGEMHMVRLIDEDRKHGECHFGFYKNAKDIPEHLYTRIGRQKPKYDE